MRRPLTVCLVAPVPPPYGGIAHWTSMVTRYAAASRPDLRLEVVDTAPRWRAIDDLAVWKRVFGGGVQLLRDVARFLFVLAGKRPHAVHLTTSGQLAVVRDISIMLLARAFGTPVVYHLRFGRIAQIAGEDTREWRLIKVALRLATVVVPIDTETERAIRARVPSAYVERIPNCVDVSELPLPESQRPATKTALFLGWVIPTKGVHELIEAWARLKPRGWRLVVAGPGSPEYPRKLIARLDAENVELVGELSHSEAMRAMASADVFVFPSHTEGFPNVILEAMALGRAIIATRVGAIPEMLAGDCGVTVASGNIEELTAALRRLTADERIRAELGARAHARATAEFGIGAVFERYVRLWRRPTSDHGNS